MTKGYSLTEKSMMLKKKRLEFKSCFHYLFYQLLHYLTSETQFPNMENWIISSILKTALKHNVQILVSNTIVH